MWPLCRRRLTGTSLGGFVWATRRGGRIRRVARFLRLRTTVTSSNAASARPIPAYLNLQAGTARAVAELLRADARFAVRELSPSDFDSALRRDAARDARRVLICGGDGTVATAAKTAAELGLEMAILPGGTLNHFARRLGIPVHAEEALGVAASAQARAVDVGFMNEKLFLNTSSVGAYVTYVRLRERIERWLGYYLGSAVAALRLLFRLRSLSVRLQVEGSSRIYASPLVFVGVGERRLATPRFGEPVRGGFRALHLVVVDGSSPARHLVRALTAAARGSDTVHRTPGINSHLADLCTVDLPVPAARVALDGEIHRVHTPLRYRLAREALHVVAPEPEDRREDD